MTAPAIENAVKIDLLAALRENEVFLRGVLGEMHTENGVMLRDQFNLSRVSNLTGILNARIVDIGYGQAINDLLSGLTELETEIRDKYKGDLNESQKFSLESQQAVDMLLQDAQADMLKIANLEAESLSSYIRKSILGTGRLEDLLGQVSKELEIRYNQAVVLVTTAVYSFQQMVTIDIGEELGVEWYLYAGPNDSVTRDWCEHWVGTRGTLEQFEATANDWDRANQPNPVSYWRGGYNCRHELRPLIGSSWKRYPQGPRE